MKLKILFVDDEPNVLSGLRLVLRGMRKEWDMFFATSGSEGLELLEQTPVDVVVSDMRMPGMSGGEFLSIVQERYPDTIRLILSGYSDYEMIMKTVKPAHQFLSKPCSHESLTEVISRTMRLRDVLTNDAIRTMLTTLDSLPLLPETYTRLEEEMRMEVPSLQTIGQLVEEDMGMTTSLLKMVNSSFFGLRRHIGSPRQAVVLLGTDTVKGLVLMAELFRQFEAGPELGFSTSLLWKHCTHVGHMAREIANAEGADSDTVDQSFIAGLLHDVGKLILLTQAPEQYAEVLRIVREEGLRIVQAEHQVFGASHAEVGAYLLALWGLEEEIVEAIFKHHGCCGGVVATETVTAQVAVHAANMIEHQLIVINPEYTRPEVDMELLEQFGFAEKYEEWFTVCKDMLEREEEEEA